ncbi:MAG: sensor histidine kinase [Thermoleophilia bacterium]
MIFSLSVFILFSRNAADNLDYHGPDNGGADATIEARVIEQAQNRLEVILFIVDGVIILGAAGTSYYVAGKTLRPVEESYAAQKKFVADAAHELRTPLTILRTGAEAVLGEASSKEEYIKYIRDSLEESEYLTSMVNDLLFLARGAKLSRAEQVRLDFGAIVRKQVEFMRPYAGGKGVRLSGADSMDEDFFVNGNPDHLRRLLGNLIRNAIDYNREGGKVNIALNSHNKEIILTVADTGLGIEPAKVAKVFDRFYKLDQARARARSGTGLGLAIVKEIVDAHKGKINIKSKPGKGTEIKVFFPAA